MRVLDQVHRGALVVACEPAELAEPCHAKPNRVSGAARPVAHIDSTLLARQVQRLHNQLSQVPHLAGRIECALSANATARGGVTRSAVTGARRHLAAMAATSEVLAAHIQADDLGPCESLAELVVRAIRLALVVEIEALRRGTGAPETQGRRRGLSMTIDDFTRPLVSGLAAIAAQCVRHRGTSLIYPAGYRASLIALSESLRVLVARPDIVMFLAEARARTDWPELAQPCQRIARVTQLELDFDAAWSAHPLSQRVDVVSRMIAEQCERAARRANLRALSCLDESDDRLKATASGHAPMLVVVPVGMVDPVTQVAAWIRANPGITTTALGRCLALQREPLRRALRQLVRSHVIRVEEPPRQSAGTGSTRDRVCFANADASCASSSVTRQCDPHGVEVSRAGHSRHKTTYPRKQP